MELLDVLTAMLYEMELEYDALVQRMEAVRAAIQLMEEE